MQSGVISSENVAQVLRNIAQKRQNGSLDITQTEEKCIIIFSNGKIVDAYKESENVLARAARRMDRLAEDCRPEVLKAAVKHDVLNFLFELDLTRSSIYEFRNYMPEFDKDLAANISVGQFLLDKASLDSELKRFSQIFEPQSVIVKFELAGLELSEEEKVFYDTVPDRTTVEKLFDLTYFSRYHVVVNLLSFYERAIIEIEKDSAGLNSDSAVGTDIIGVLEDTSARRYVEKELSPETEAEESISDDSDFYEAPSDTYEEEVPEKVSNDEFAAKPEIAREVKPEIEKKPVLKTEINFYGISPVLVSLLYLLFAIVILSGWSRYLAGF